VLFEPIEFQQLNEADVRAEIIDPLLRLLGYRAGATDSKIIREQSLLLRYDKASLDRKNQKSDLVLRGRADYICEVDNSIRWVIEAKPPVVALSSLSRVSENPALLLLVAFFLAGFSYLFSWGRRLRFVSVDERNLYVSAGGGEVKIPFSQIMKVRESFWSNPKQITILLREPSEVGGRIVFLPAFRMFGFVRHPTARKLKQAAKSHRW
jgi:hypothetical protein